MLSFTSNLSSKSDALTLFVTESYEYKDKKRILSKELTKRIDLFLKSLKSKSKKEEINSFDISDKKKCFVIKIKNKRTNYYFEDVGGAFFSYVKKLNNINSIDVYADSLNENKEKLVKYFSEFIFGFKLKSYSFKKYKSLKIKEEFNSEINSNIITSYKNQIESNYKYYNALKEGVFLTRDLVSEPGNILHPDEYVKRIIKLKKYGLKVVVYDEKKLKKLGCNALSNGKVKKQTQNL